MSNPLRIAVAGLGTVGAGTISILQRHRDMIAQRAGRDVTIVAASARDLTKKRDIDLSGIDIVNDAVSLATRSDVDVVVEVIGGHEGAAKTLVESALRAGKHVVTANKALIAHHGVMLAKLSEIHGVTLAFEAAVAGGIPVIAALRSGLAANRIEKISGILNGTCNYILSRMYHEQLEQGVVMADAAKLGYLEADPSLDIDGIDAAHKIAILASLAFGTQVDVAGVKATGIRSITLRDVRYADAFGYRIKLLGVAEFHDGTLIQSVHPALVAKALPLASVDSSFNAVQIEGDSVGRVMFEGRGAGAGPTGSAVVADIIALARGDRYPAFTVPTASLIASSAGDVHAQRACFYLRLSLKDEPGVLAEFTRVFAEEDISVRAITQRDIAEDASAQVVVLTHVTTSGQIARAHQKIAGLAVCVAPPVLMQMEG